MSTNIYIRCDTHYNPQDSGETYLDRDVRLYGYKEMWRLIDAMPKLREILAMMSEEEFYWVDICLDFPALQHYSISHFVREHGTCPLSLWDEYGRQLDRNGEPIDERR